MQSLTKSAAAETAGSNRLPILAAAINDHLTAAETATKRGLEHAIAAGVLLLEAKNNDSIEHGDWLPWLEANCRCGVRQAQTYMRLARNRHRLDALKNAAAAHLTIAAAEALVGRPKPERPHGLPGQLDLLGGPEVTAIPKAPALRGRALIDLIVDLEQARAIIEQQQLRRMTRQMRESRRQKLQWAADTIAAVITTLKTRWQREKRKGARPRSKVNVAREPRGT